MTVKVLAVQTLSHAGSFDQQRPALGKAKVRTARALPKCPAKCSARRKAATIQLAVAAELDRGTRSRVGQGMIGCREKRDFEEEPPRQGLETWILFSPSIVDCVVQPMRHGIFSSKVQDVAADVFNRMWTCAKGEVGIMLHEMLIGYKASGWELRRGLSPDMRRVLGIGDWWALECGGEGVGF